MPQPNYARGTISQQGVVTRSTVPSDLSQKSSSALASISNQRGVYLRALSARLGELKDLSSIWKGGIDLRSSRIFTSNLSEVPPSETVYLNFLQKLGNCHIWTVADVLSNISSCNGQLTLVVPNPFFSLLHPLKVSSEITIPFQGGVPLWSFPNYPSTEFIQYLVPLLISLLTSSKEDYIFAAVEVTKSLSAAVSPLFTTASKGSKSDVKSAIFDDVLAEKNEVGTRFKFSSIQIRQLELHVATTQAVELFKVFESLLEALLTATKHRVSTSKLCENQYSLLYNHLDSIRHLI